MCSLISEEIRNFIHSLLLKPHPHQSYQCSLHYEQLYRAPTSVIDGIFLQYFVMLNFDGFSTKVYLKFHHWWVFLAEKEFFSWTYLPKRTRWGTKISISPDWNKISKMWDIFFELIEIEVQCSKNYFKISLITRSWSFRK